MVYEVYQPREDSYLLAESVKAFADGKVLDMGTGSGIQALTASKLNKVNSVVGVDINLSGIKDIKQKKVKFLKSDLFSNVKGKFDTVVFNPPYLPQDKGVIDPTLYGGKKGYEIIGRFLSKCSEHLNPSGIVLLLYSTQTKEQKVKEFVEKYGFEFEIVGEKKLFFEILYVVKLVKSPILKKLEDMGCSNIELLAKGNRGVIHTCNLKGKKVAVKTKRPDSTAHGRIANEAKWLKILNKKGIGPELLKEWKDGIMYKFVEGKFILDFIDSAKKPAILKVLKNLLLQSRKMDLLNVNKEEMRRPYKHAIIGKNNKATLLDFERCRKIINPANVTQFCQFLINPKIETMLKRKGININKKSVIVATKEYKKAETKSNFETVARLL
jgi:release factor glutamine methyltransferase